MLIMQTIASYRYLLNIRTVGGKAATTLSTCMNGGLHLSTKATISTIEWVVSVR